MKLQNIKYLLILLATYTCQGQTKHNSSKYTVGQIDSLQSFSTLTSQELRIDSLLQSNTWFNGAYRNNRGRILLHSFKNGQLQSGGDSNLVTGLPAPCMCYIKKETIFIKTWTGFFGAMGFEIKIFKDEFNSQFIIQIDQPDTYKVNLSDKKFTGQAIVNSRYQNLTFLTKPNFKLDELLTGSLEITTNNYYEKKYNSIDTLSVSGKIYFTCMTRKKTLKDKLIQ